MRLATSQAGETTVSEYEALAKNVIRGTLHIQPKENVIVETGNHGLPIATEVVYQVRAAGARPMLLFEDEDMYWKSVNTLPESKLGKVGSHEWKAMSEADGYVFIPGPADITKIREAGKKFSASTAYNDEWYRRAKRNRLRGDRLRSAHRVGGRMDPRRPSRLRWRPDGEILGFGERGSHPVRVGRGEGAEGPPWIPRHRTESEGPIGVPARCHRRRKRIRRGRGERRGPRREEQDGLLPRRESHGCDGHDRRSSGYPEGRLGGMRGSADLPELPAFPPFDSG